MGLFKKYIDRMQAGSPDYEGEVRKCQQPGEQLLGIGCARHAVSEVGGRKLLEVAVNTAIVAHQKGQHLNGEKGSCAAAIPRSGQLMVAISDQRVSFWDFGMMMTDVPPAEALAFPRSSVTSIEAVGTPDVYGHMTRFSFVDGSFADMKVMEQPTYAGFVAACAGLSG